MMSDMEKFYIYVDESGQETQGRFFVVATIIMTADWREEGEQNLFAIERRTGKKKPKWYKTHHRVKERYLQEIISLDPLKHNIFYATYENTTDYIPLTAETIIETLKQKITGEYVVTIGIDGLEGREVKEVTHIIKANKIRYRKVRGMRDESSAWIRLADAIAGFINDTQKNKPYTRAWYPQLQQAGFLIEIKKAGVSGSSNPT
jgi:hypothetical protein